MQTIDTRRGRGLLFAAVMVLMFFGSIEILLRFVGVDRPPSPRLVVRAIDIDISFPFMRPDRELFWSPIPGFRGEFLGETVPWCTTPIEAESSLGPDSHHPIISLSGIRSAVMVLRILHPILASTLCAANPLARIAEPTIAL